MREFDLPEYQKQVRETLSPKELFLMWDRVSCFYEKGEISSHELDLMKESIWPRLKNLATLSRTINNAF